MRLQSRAYQTVEAVLHGIQNDAHVARPDNQISGLRDFDAFKIFVPGVNIERADIRILKARNQINLVHHVRAIVRPAHRLVLFQRRVDNRAPLGRIQQPEIRLRLQRRSGGLCPCTWDSGATSANQTHSQRQSVHPSQVKFASHLPHRPAPLASSRRSCPLPRIHFGLEVAIELVLNVIGRWASLWGHWKSAGFYGWIREEGRGLRDSS